MSFKLAMLLYFRPLLLSGILFVFFGGQIILNLTISRHAGGWVEPPESRVIDWDPRLAKALAFGHTASLVDSLWIRTLQESGLTHVEKGQHAPAFYDLKLASLLDPAYFDLHLYGANYLSVIRRDGTGAEFLLLRAQDFRKQQLSNLGTSFRERFWNREWAIPFTLGFVYANELDDLPNAGKAYTEAGKLPGAPAFVGGLGEKLKTPRGQYEVAINYLAFVLKGAKEGSEYYERVFSRYQSAQVGYYLFDLNDRFQGFLHNQAWYEKRKGAIPFERMQKEWEYFRRYYLPAGQGSVDPMGGELYLDSSGKILSKTEREKVFSLEY